MRSRTGVERGERPWRGYKPRKRAVRDAVSSHRVSFLLLVEGEVQVVPLVAVLAVVVRA